ncbi:CB069 protein, partial [Atractosteus spatula]|nr:CB069 protein [Atractosteus spatula]
ALFLRHMFSIRTAATALSLITVARNMSSAAGFSETEGPSPRQGDPDGQCSQQRWFRLPAVPGFEPHRVNEMLLLRPTAVQSRCSSETHTAEDATQHVVFFPGDIQNFQQEMSKHQENGQWQHWSLERVALLLGHRFPGHHVWVVRAARMYLHKFSCYDNFVESNLFGAPEHSPNHGAFQHLKGLLSHAMEQAGILLHHCPAQNSRPFANGCSGPSNVTSVSCPLPPNLSLSVVGFSKGCVVLNQMVYELAGAKADPELAAFLASIRDMYWLDGGHPGGSETWVTDRKALQALASSGIGLHAHVTPYEVHDPMRAWVGREHRRFVRTLQELGAPLICKLHFEDEPPSLDNHFRVIQDF